MAEEKKETTKKTTSKKKEPIEEVKVEKRFCTKCGKELKEGEVCSCSAEGENSSNPEAIVNTDVIVNTGKDLWNTILNVFKKPTTTVSEEANNKRSNKSVILTIILAISFAFYLMAIFASTARNVEDSLWGATTIDVPYFQIFIYGIIIYAIMAILPVVAAIIIAKITKNNNFNFKKSFNLYITSNAPMIFAYLGMAIILLLNVKLLTVLGTIATLIIGVFCFFNFIFGFNSETKIKDDRRSYAITGLISLWVIMICVAFMIVAATFADGIIDEITDNSNNYSDIFNW